MSIFRGKDGRPTKKSYLSDMPAKRVSWLDNFIILELRKAIKENIKQIKKCNWRISIKQLEQQYKPNTVNDYEMLLKETKYRLSKALALRKSIKKRIANQYYNNNKTSETYDLFYANAMAKHIK